MQGDQGAKDIESKLLVKQVQQKHEQGTKQVRK